MIPQYTPTAPPPPGPSPSSSPVHNSNNDNNNNNNNNNNNDNNANVNAAAIANHLLEISFEIKYLMISMTNALYILAEKRQYLFQCIFATDWLSPSVYHFLINLVEENTNQKPLNDMFFHHMLLYNHYDFQNLCVIRDALLVNYRCLKQRIVECDLLKQYIFSNLMNYY